MSVILSALFIEFPGKATGVGHEGCTEDNPNQKQSSSETVMEGRVQRGIQSKSGLRSRGQSKSQSKGVHRSRGTTDY